MKVNDLLLTKKKASPKCLFQNIISSIGQSNYEIFPSFTVYNISVLLATTYTPEYFFLLISDFPNNLSFLVHAQTFNYVGMTT